MHSTQIGNVTFFHNGDFSGPVYFKAPDRVTGSERSVAVPFPVIAAAVTQHAGVPGSADVQLGVRAEGESVHRYGAEEITVVVPADALRGLVGKRVAYDRISRLEEMSYDEVCADALDREVLAWVREEADWS